jgi:hypothetical protein
MPEAVASSMKQRSKTWLTTQSRRQPPNWSSNSSVNGGKLVFLFVFSEVNEWHGNGLSGGRTAGKIAVKELRRRRI